MNTANWQHPETIIAERGIAAATRERDRLEDEWMECSGLAEGNLYESPVLAMDLDDRAARAHKLWQRYNMALAQVTA